MVELVISTAGKKIILRESIDIKTEKYNIL